MASHRVFHIAPDPSFLIPPRRRARHLGKLPDPCLFLLPFPFYYLRSASSACLRRLVRLFCALVARAAKPADVVEKRKFWTPTTTPIQRTTTAKTSPSSPDIGSIFREIILSLVKLLSALLQLSTTQQILWDSKREKVDIASSYREPSRTLHGR